jgi:hypothetical protein
MAGVSGQMAATIYRRSAAGDDEATESQIRCPAALLLTVDFLFQRALDADCFGIDPRMGAVPDLITIFNFVFNRTRSIRRDYSTQNYGAKQRNDALVIEVRCGRAGSMCFWEVGLGWGGVGWGGVGWGGVGWGGVG